MSSRTCRRPSRVPLARRAQRLGYEHGRFYLEHSLVRSSGRTVMRQRCGHLQPERRPSRTAPSASIRTCSSRCSTRSIELWAPARGYWREHVQDLRASHDHRPVDGCARCRRRRPACSRRRRGLAALLPRARRSRRYATRLALLDAENGPWVAASRPDHAPGTSVGTNRRHRQRHLSPRRPPPPGWHVYLSYGAADRHVGAATVAATQLLEALRAAG